MEITWDDAKAQSNARKHGVTFEEAATCLYDPLAMTFRDDDEGEVRFVTIGQSALQRTLLVVWCERAEEVIRIISARPAAPLERKAYEEGL